MRSWLIKNILLNSLVIYLVMISGIASGQLNELGHYPIYNFSPKQYSALNQNWCAVQDSRGIMYFGNNKGVLEYDGEEWNLIPATDGSPVYSLAADENGRIFFGSVNEFGYLLPDSIGQLEYYLLSDLLPEEYRGFSEIWETHVIDGGVIFQSFHHIFICHTK